MITKISDAAISEFIAESEEIVERVVLSLTESPRKKSDSELIRNIYRDIHTQKGAAQLVGASRVGERAHQLEERLESLKKTTDLKIQQAHIDEILSTMDLIVFELKEFQQSRNPSRSSGAPDPIPPTPAPNRMTAGTASPAPAVPSSDEPSSSPEQAGEPSGTIRVAIPLLDRLMSLMSEMVLIRNQVLQYSHSSDDINFLNLSQRLDVITASLQNEMMKTRMQPIGSIIGKFHRVVRDLEQSLKKEIHLNLIGSETELDRSLLELIKDPLNHIVRNSCDHGIETPEERAAAGKPRKGTLTIKAFHEGGQFFIEVLDDGRGLNRDRLIEKAIEKGIIRSEQAKSMSEKEVCRLIFHPGFSTAKAVSNISGRGVGMDVVKSNIEKIGGSVDLDSVSGKYTKVSLKIPLTLAIVPALTVRAGKDRFAIPQARLIELALARTDGQGEIRLDSIQGKEVLRIRDKLLSLVRLNEIMKTSDLSDQATGHELALSGAQYVAIVNADCAAYAIVVDEILDTTDIVVKPLGRILKSLNLYSGATILGDGQAALILDTNGLANHANLAESNLNKARDPLAEAGLQTASQTSKDYLVFTTGLKGRFALPLLNVHRLEEIQDGQLEYSRNTRVLNYRGEILPIFHAHEIFGGQRPEMNGDQDLNKRLPMIVLEVSSRRIGLEVQRIEDVISIDTRLQSNVIDHPSIRGNVITGNGVIVILDEQKVIKVLNEKFIRSQELAS
ncbi:MAG: chemotaxis protein CheW [Bdellovibrionales bacterium]|nr:chemotaxis protein CheW [Bdellovibrionales bacterium]